VSSADALTPRAARFGVVASLAVFVLGLAYVIPLILGLRSLAAPQDPIADPYFAAMELLILLMAPALVAMMAAIHAYAPRDAKVFSLTALVFMGVAAGVTCGVHFLLLTVGRQVSPAESPWLSMMFSFRWPAVTYALDILAWDLFYPLALLFAAPVLRGDGLPRAVRTLLLVSGTLSLVGLAGAAVGDMGLRNIGIVGYAGLGPIVALLLAIVFRRTVPTQSPSSN
jgi:hypothetical protein